jgi:hypothetical protein
MNLRTVSLSDMCVELERQKKNSMDLVAPSESVKAFVERGYDNSVEAYGLAVPEPSGSGVRVYPVTGYAHKQLADKMGIPQRYYDRMIQAGEYDLWARNVNAWIGTKDRRLLRVLDGQIRAILSDKYRPIDNYDLLFSFMDQLKTFRDRTGESIEITACDLTDTRMYVRARVPSIVSAVKPGDEVQPMVMLTNSEVGAGRMAVALGMYRLVCSNGLWHEDIVQRVHLGQKLELGVVEWSEMTIRKTDEALFAQVADTVRTALEPTLWEKYMTKTVASAQVELTGNITEIVNLAAPRLGMSQEERDRLVDMFAQELGTPAGKTQWGLANAVTRLARDTEDADRQVELEILGGELVAALPQGFLAALPTV